MVQRAFRTDNYQLRFNVRCSPTDVLRKMAKLQRFSKDTHWYRSNSTAKPVVMPLLYLFCALTLLSVVEDTEISLHCEDGWKLIIPSKRCYKYFDVWQPWQEARSTCISYSAVLAEPVGYEVNAELRKLIINISSTAKNAWIGYNYIDASKSDFNMDIGNWSDWSRASITVGLWDTNQPSLDSGRCADISETTKNQWKWRLSPCEDRKPFLCQRTACTQGTFNCRIAGKHSACLDKAKVCDGVSDCPNGFDESVCPERNRFYIRKDAGEINSTSIIRENQKNNNGTIYQWTIEGKIGSRLQLSLDSTEALDDFSTLEVWLAGRTLQDSYRYGTYAETLSRVENVISNNNFAIIRWAVYKSHHQKILNITWSSDPLCYWKHVSNRSDANVAPIRVADLRQGENISSCLDACNSTCSIVTVDKVEKKCYFFELVPLVLPSSHYESYVKICPSKTRYLHELTSGKTFQVFHSTTYPLEYSENAHHTWILTAPLWEIITLQFIDLDLDPQASIIVYNGKNSAYKMLAKLVSGSVPTILFSTGNTLAIHFRAGPKSVMRRGFLARYKSGCDLSVKSDFVHIQSPGYDTSTPYPPRLDCTWKIHSKTEPPALTLKFDPKFGLEKDKDFLQVYNGTMLTKYARFAGEGFTGNTTPPTQHSFSGLFILRFMTSAIISDIGFRATFSSITYCGPVPDLVDGYWESVSGFYSGHNATYTCLENYNSATANTIYCTDLGNWKPIPKCIVKECPPLYNLTNGAWVKEDNVYRAVCHQHSRLIGYPIVICWNRTWRGRPTCTKIPCQDFYMPKNSVGITPQNVTFYKGDTLNITCARGYHLKGKNPFLCGVQQTPTCVDIDECTGNASVCEQVCINTPSSYECVCFPGYKKNNLSSNRSSCIDVDECKINNGDCSHNCTNLPGSYKCSCPKGWELFQTNGQHNVSVLPGDTGHDPGDYYRFNHSCIRIICPRPDVKNGFHLTDTSNFYCDDSVNIFCQEGYQLIGNSTATCLETGNWTSLPVCKRGTCPPVTSKSGRVEPPGVTNYGQIITINCSFAGKTHIRSRQCVWNMQNKTFSTVGDSPECPVIDCGTPKKFPGTRPYQYQCTTSSCSFNFTCLPDFNLTGSGNGPTNQTVICSSDGRWQFNDLACKGSTCKDPGRPADGEQIGNSYEEGSLITFHCYRPGFEPSNPYPLKCVYNRSLNWNGTVPQCVDKEKPKIFNCSSETLYVKKMTTLSIPMPKAIDNSGEFIKVKVTPRKFRINQLILTGMNITYTAKDTAENTATCTFQIKLEDLEKPTLTCPNITTYLLYETATLSKENFTVNVSDNSGQVNLTYEPRTLEIGERPNAAYVIKVTATDPSNNTEICYIQVKTKDVPNTQCDRRRLLIPNSKITCQNTSANISCNVSCTKGNLFFDQPAVNTRVIVCDPSKGWATEGIYCVPQQKSAFQITLVYTYDTKNRTCVQNSLENQITSFYKRHSSFLKNTFVFDMAITKPSVGNLQAVSTAAFGGYVNATLRLELVSQKATASEFEMVANASVLPFYGKIKANKFNLTCGPTVHVVASRVGFVCQSAGKAFIVNEEGICVSCPPGTYGKDFYKCIPCPENTYNSDSNKTQCTTCSPGTYVNKKGSRSIHSCYNKCPPGFYSADGFVPCMPCPEQTYSYNTTLCKSCSAGKKTSSRGASSESDCKTECQPGSYSESGFEPCTSCPPNTYAEHNGAKMCDPCADISFIKTNGSANRTDCKRNLVCLENVCQNGGSCRTFHYDYYCDCPKGFKGQNCSESINPCQSSPCFYNQTCSHINNTNNYSCTCQKGFHGLHCEKEDNSCERNYTCQNNGACKDLVGGYECLCPSWSGYTGPRCEIQILPCRDNKCQNNATCVPAGKIRNQCICLPGFTGELCEKDIDDCASVPCVHGGKCVDAVNNFTCQCRNGFHGRFCESVEDPCQKSTCGKNKICKRNYFNNTPHCVCVKNFILNPQNKNECIAHDLCTKILCKNNGTCQPVPEPFTCMCPSGYVGSRCHRTTSECTNSSSCQSGEECRRVGSTYKCVCKTPVIEGVRCVEAIDYCKGNHCEPESTHNCISLAHGYTCNCSEGFSGRYCQVKPCDLRCLHGDCITQAGNWTCKCYQGWKGDNCSELINQCDSNPCQNQGKCFGNLKEFHCICPPGFRNKTCGQAINFCERTNHCVGNGSKCQNDATRATCICAKGHGGIGCQNSSPCTPTTCKNGGTCEIRGNKTNCICPIGFGDERCNTPIDPCDAIKGCNKSQCERQGQQAFCKCVVGKIGRYCKQDVLYEVDLVFPRSKGFMQPTPIPMWSRLTRHFLTLSFCIKYYLPVQKDGLTTSLVLYGTDKPDGKSQITELLSLNKDSLTIQFSEIEAFKLTGVDDGRWHQVFVTWSNSSISIYLDSKLVINDQYGKDKTLPMFGVLIPAGTIDGSRYTVKPSKFAGRINRLVLLNSRWTAEKVKNSRNPMFPVLQDVLLDFYRSVLNMANVLLEFPSEISQDICHLNPNCTSHFPTVMCPHAQMKVASRWAKLDWVQPRFFHNSTTVSNYIPGKSYFDWGPHTIAYIAFGERNETSAVCTFQLFSRRFSCQDTISISYLNDTERNCRVENESIICTPSCNGTNKQPAIPGPLVYSCGVSQMWGKGHTSHFRFPSCATVTSVQKVNLKIEMTIKFEGAQPLPSALCAEVQKSLQAILITYNLCSKQNCSTCSWKSTNTVRRKRSLSNPPVEVNLKNVNSSLVNGIPTKDLLLSEIVDNKKFNYKALNASVLAGTVTITASCTTGQQLNGQTCVVVQPVPGTFLNNATKQIEICPKGTYQPNVGQTSCIQCPPGMTSMGDLSLSKEECKAICTTGNYFSSKNNQCTLCDFGFYQSRNGSFLCDGCPNGMSTTRKGSTSPDKCVTPVDAAAVALGGLSARDIAIIVVVSLLVIFLLLCILLFCCRTKIKKIFPCLMKNKVAHVPEQKERYSKSNVKMVSYNLTNIRERRMGVGNDQKSYPQRNDHPESYHDNNSDVSSSLEGSMQDFLPLTKRQPNEGKSKKTRNGSNAWLSNGDALLQMHQQPRIGAESQSGGLLVKVKPKRPKNNVVKVHLSNFPRKEPKIMVDSDEEDVR